jgi:hypothetical protein
MPHFSLWLTSVSSFHCCSSRTVLAGDPGGVTDLGGGPDPRRCGGPAGRGERGGEDGGVLSECEGGVGGGGEWVGKGSEGWGGWFFSASSSSSSSSSSSPSSSSSSAFLSSALALAALLTLRFGEPGSGPSFCHQEKKAGEGGWLREGAGLGFSLSPRISQSLC